MSSTASGLLGPQRRVRAPRQVVADLREPEAAGASLPALARCQSAPLGEEITAPFGAPGPHRVGSHVAAQATF